MYRLKTGEIERFFAVSAGFTGSRSFSPVVKMTAVCWFRHPETNQIHPDKRGQDGFQLK